MHRNHLYCKEFIDKSKYVYNWMKKQPSVGEESITDWLLFALSESLTSLKYKTFSRHKEARETGADWEWWFVDDKKALCLRIQAKKLFASKSNCISHERRTFSFLKFRNYKKYHKRKTSFF